jgi:hypothetical protein
VLAVTGSDERVRLRSFKLRFVDDYVWIVPATDPDGCAFAGPGVTLRGDDALRVFAFAKPLLDALARFEPGITVRALSLDLERHRLLATLAPITPDRDARPRVVRADAGPLLDEILREADPLFDELRARAASALRRRATSGG